MTNQLFDMIIILPAFVCGTPYSFITIWVFYVKNQRTFEILSVNNVISQVDMFVITFYEIIANKCQAQEVFLDVLFEQHLQHSLDFWKTYFPKILQKQHLRQVILDFLKNFCVPEFGCQHRWNGVKMHLGVKRIAKSLARVRVKLSHLLHRFSR